MNIEMMELKQCLRTSELGVVIWGFGKPRELENVLHCAFFLIPLSLDILVGDRFERIVL